MSITEIYTGGPRCMLLRKDPPSFPDVARLLLEHGADLSARCSGDISTGRTPLHIMSRYNMIASRHNLIEVVHVLLEHGANVAAEDDEGRIPSNTAGELGNVDIG